MRGRLFESLKESVEGPLREHVRFVDDVYLVSSTRRCIFNSFPEIPYVVHACVGCAVYLVDVYGLALGHGLAGCTLAAWCRGGALFAVESLCENARR